MNTEQEKNFLFEHNITLYTQMEHYLDTLGRALVVLGPGLGKTSTTLEYISKIQRKGLVLCPNVDIKDSWSAYSQYVDAKTYQEFSNVYKTLDYSMYKIVILDEAHHIGYDKESDIGAKVWSKGVDYLLSRNCKILGLTATPERGDGIDISKTIFKDCVCTGYDISEAIENNIIYDFSYITAVYNIDEVTNDIINKVGATDKDTTKALLGQLDLIRNNTAKVHNILTKYIKKQKIIHPKGIVFVSANREGYLNTIDGAKNIIKKAFPDIEIRVLYSDEEYMKKEFYQNNLDNKKWFEKTDEGFIITINKAGEGWHPKGINTLIMFRKTNSYPLFIQQLGRIITLKEAASINPHAIVFDLVNNVDNVGFKYTSYTNNKNNIEKIIRTLEAKKSNQIIVADETQEFVKCIQQIKEDASILWSSDEQQRLKTMYYDATKDELISAFPYRTWHSIKKQASIMGLRRKLNYTPYTEEEDGLIVNNYTQYGLKYCRQLIEDELGINRTLNSVSDRAIKVLRLHRHEKFTKKAGFDLDTFQKVYHTLGVKECMTKFNMTEDQVRQLAGRCNITREKSTVRTGIIPKMVRCVELDKIFDSVKEAGEYLNITSIRHIHECCKGERKTAHGYHWIYMEN